MPENASVPLNRIERVLASMIAGVVGLSLLAIVGTLIGSVSGADMSTGVWPALLGMNLAAVLHKWGPEAAPHLLYERIA